MRRISTSIRASLLHDASPQSQRQLNRWSLQSLAKLNDSSSISNNNSGSHQFETTYQPQQQHPQKDVAELLLNEVKLRLAKQHSRCLALMKDVDKFYDGILNKQVTTTTTTTTPHSPNGKQQQHPIIIPAINAPVAGKNYQSLSTLINRLQQTQSTRRAVTQIVKNLIILHADTYTLTHQLLPSSSSSHPPETTTSQSPLHRFSPADRQLIAATFEQLRSRHATSVENMADILLGLRRSHASHSSSSSSSSSSDNHDTNNNAICPIDERLKDSFLRDRLGIQLLCDHYVALHKGHVPNGGITTDCDLKSIVEPAITEACHVCTSHWGWAPDVNYGGDDDDDEEGGGGGGGVWDDCRLTLVRPWMHHVLVELLKNAMASCVKQRIRERGGGGDGGCGGWEEEDVEEDIWGNRPSVTIRARETEDCVLLMIIDEGVGLDEEGMKLAFRFAMTSSHRRWDRLDEQQSYASVQTVPLTGLGVGLPLSRMMLRMFGGDVELVNRGDDGCNNNDDGAMTTTATTTTGCIATIRIMKDSSIPEWDGIWEGDREEKEEKVRRHDNMEDDEERMEIGNRAE